MPTMVDYKDRLQQAMKDAGVSTARLARALEISYQAVAKVISGQSAAFNAVNNAAAARVLGVDSDWLATGQGVKQSVSKYADVTTPGPAGALGTREPASVYLTDNPNYPAIRRVSFKLSATVNGFSVDYLDDEDAPIVFRATWFQSNGFQPDKLFAVKVANGSMEDGLHDGDTVVVNTADVTPKDGIVFAVNYEGELVIKRLVRDAGQWWLQSDNKDQQRYPRKVVTEHTFIIGRIVHKQSERI